RAVPASVDLTQYGILPEHRMDALEMANMGLVPILADKAVQKFNFSHKANAFILDTIKKGELVAATPSGEWVYKASCSNRLADPIMPTEPAKIDCPECPSPCPSPCPTPQPFNPNATPANTDTSTSDGCSWPWILFGVCMLFLLLLLLALAGWALSEMMHARRNRTAASQQPTYAPPAPPFHRALGVGTRGRNGEVWYGPFKTVTINDRGVGGYHVNVDGRDVDTFTRPIRLENAGAAGSYVVTDSIDWTRPQ
ncbi:MAG: hypothetical protein UY01_C0031G0001, partial [Candidatus Nomurabacteria bacterium GW2011_GWB1_47_6]